MNTRSQELINSSLSLKQQTFRLLALTDVENSILLQTLAGSSDVGALSQPRLQLDLRRWTEVTHESEQTYLYFSLVVSQGGKGKSGARLSHGGSGGLPPCSLRPDEGLLGAGPTQETHLPQTEGETGVGDELTPRGPGGSAWTGPGTDLGEHKRVTWWISLTRTPHPLF